MTLPARALVVALAISLGIPVFSAECESVLIDGVRYHLPGVSALIAQDTDLDGRPDLIAATELGTELLIFRNQVDGFFRTSSIALGHRVRRLYEADLDGDGLEEIIVNGVSHISTLFANGDGTYRVVTSAFVKDLYGVSALGDFNADGRIDLAAFGTDQILRVYAGSSAGTFTLIGTAPQRVGTRAPYSMAAAELTGDTHLDLVIGSDVNTAIFPGNGDGTFATPRQVDREGFLRVATGDFDGDQRADIIVRYAANGPGRFYSSKDAHATWKRLACVGTAETLDLDADGKLDMIGDVFQVCRGNGDGTFSEEWTGATYFIEQTSQVHSMSVADFDGDGRLDIAGASGDDDITVFLGKPNLKFSGSRDYAVPSGSMYIDAADVNGDGRDDVIVNGSGTMNVFVGGADGSLTFSTRSNELGYGATATGDVNHDGKLDIFTSDGSFLGRGDGTFDRMSGAADFGNVGSMIATDLNGDQRTDFVASLENPDSRVLIWLGHESGTPVGSSYPAPFEIDRLAVADVTGDSIPDVLMLGEERSQDQFLTLRMMPGRLDGTLGPSVLIADQVVSRDVLAARFDTDAHTDLVFARRVEGDGDVVVVLRGTGNGAFVERQRFPLPADSFNSAEVRLTMGDFNGDGRRDLAALVPQFDRPITWVLLQNQHSMFIPGWFILHTVVSNPAVAGDFNGDGIDDLAVLTSSESMDVHLSACETELLAVPASVNISGPNRAAKGTAVTFTALVDPPEASGYVTFYGQRGGQTDLLGTAPLIDGQASMSVSFSTTERRKIYAIYSGDGPLARSMSEVLVHQPTAPTGKRRRTAVGRR
jgi:hypothetical protein